VKRRYEPVRVITGRRELKILVIVHELGPTWSIELAVPYEHLDAKELYESITSEQERLLQYQHRHDAFENDSLF